jgi:hypothetical protein
MLRDLLAGFQQPGNQQVLGVSVAQHHAGLQALGDEVRIGAEGCESLSSVLDVFFFTSAVTVNGASALWILQR